MLFPEMACLIIKNVLDSMMRGNEASIMLCWLTGKGKVYRIEGRGMF